MKHNEKTSDQDAMYRQLAKRYADEYGEQLLQEAEQLPKVNTPELDKRVRHLIHRLKPHYVWGAIGVVAAMLIFMLASPMLRSQPPSSQMADSQSADNQSVDSIATENPPVYVAEATLAPSSEPSYEIIPLAFATTPDFTIADVDQDHGQTIYNIANVGQDDIVLTLERSAQLQPEGMTEIMIGGVTAYGAYTADYSVLTFTQGGILYTLTCQYDIQTLIALGELILI